jgi:hypothetical protein
MDIRNLLYARISSVIAAVIILPLFSCFLLYLVLLGAEYFSMRQASRMLNRLEAIRPGDPVAQLDKALKDCAIHRDGFGYQCQIISGADRFGVLGALASKLTLEQNYKLRRMLDRAGLRSWALFVSSRVRDGSITDVYTHVTVWGEPMTLGAGWYIATRLPELETEISDPDEQRTRIRGYHITSLPGGEGITVETTPVSTQQEMLARRIDRACLFSFRGCRDLCEILPNAAVVGRERAVARGIALQPGCPFH